MNDSNNNNKIEKTNNFISIVFLTVQRIDIIDKHFLSVNDSSFNSNTIAEFSQHTRLSCLFYNVLRSRF